VTETQQIEAYLNEHPEFFVDHPYLITALKIPLDTGPAISLIEYQLRKLRDQVKHLERENDHMIEVARINSVLFEKTRGLVLALLDARNLHDLSIALDEQLGRSFDIPVVRLLLSDQFEIQDGLNLIRSITSRSLEDGGDFAEAISSKESWVGRVTQSHKKALFGNETTDIASCATLGLVRGHTYGLLVLGHPDAEHFQSNQDTLFLDHIGEALAMILPRLLPETN
jgi:uncharacterized protein YigA (DUF484 family)|tara:strand:+ start:7869 stop:8546 length:678 start_codon:yes stop_codon:yes gene_type:complete